MTVSVVCFDAGGTLFTERTGRGAMYAEVLGRHGLDVSETRATELMGAVHDEMPEDVGGHTRYSDGWFHEYLTRILTRLGSTQPAEPIRAELAELFTRPDSYEVFPDAFEALDDLNARGVRLAVVSNWSDRLTSLLDALRLLPFFEVVAISAVVGRSKPDPGLFAHALDRLEVSAGQALHVGDHPIRDLEGARSAGMRALLVDRDGPSGGDGAVVTSLVEVADHLT